MTSLEDMRRELREKFRRLTIPAFDRSIRDIEKEIREYGLDRFMEDAKKLGLTFKQRMMIDALDHEIISFARYVREPTERNWRQVVFQVERHNLYWPIEKFSDDYYSILSDLLDSLKSSNTVFKEVRFLKDRNRPTDRIPTFEELKRSGFFYIPYEDIDVGIRDFVRKINELPYVVTVGSCEGHNYEELLRRGWSPEYINSEWPQGYAPAYVTLYVTSNRRRDFWNWLKNVVDMEQVTIHMEPVKENRFERWEPTMAVEYTRDKVFKVTINSKRVHMPLR